MRSMDLWLLKEHLWGGGGGLNQSTIQHRQDDLHGIQGIQTDEINSTVLYGKGKTFARAAGVSLASSLNIIFECSILISFVEEYSIPPNLQRRKTKREDGSSWV